MDTLINESAGGRHECFKIMMTENGVILRFAGPVKSYPVLPLLFYLAYRRLRESTVEEMTTMIDVIA
jgi:hypothetical protein